MEGGYLRKNWVRLGLIELVAGIGAMIVGLLIVHTGLAGTVIAGWGMIFAVIGTVLTVYGFNATDNSNTNPVRQLNCPYCGRRVAPGAMMCSRCVKTRGGGKSP